MRGPYRRRTRGLQSRESRAMNEPDVIIVGAGLAGLVATHELVKAGRRVLVVDQENRNNLGGQAFWSLGGLFFVDSPEQRRLGDQGLVRARAAGLDGLGRVRPRARGPLAAAVGRGLRRLRGGREARVPASTSGCGSCRSSAGPSAATAARSGTATRCRASTSPGAPGPRSCASSPSRCSRARSGASSTFAFRHQVDELIVEDGAVVGVRGTVLEPSDALERGAQVLARGRRRVRAARPGGGRHLGRHRPQLRPGPRNWPASGSARRPST